MRTFILVISCLGAYLMLYVFQIAVTLAVVQDPVQRYVELCSWCNISVMALLEPTFGFYIHGRSPYGYADADMATILQQLQRETQSVCGHRGLLNDSDQCYIIIPPKELSTCYAKLLNALQMVPNSHSAQSQSSDRIFDRTATTYGSVNRIFCAFIDHVSTSPKYPFPNSSFFVDCSIKAIKDMDYIIKAKTLFEAIFRLEINQYLSESK